MGRGRSARTLRLIEAAEEILEEIQPATVRAVCYRLFTQGLIESMAKTETNRVGHHLTEAREDGTEGREFDEMLVDLEQQGLTHTTKLSGKTGRTAQVYGAGPQP
jgi:hypothetical protein